MPHRDYVEDLVRRSFRLRDVRGPLSDLAIPRTRPSLMDGGVSLDQALRRYRRQRGMRPTIGTGEAIRKGGKTGSTPSVPSVPSVPDFKMLGKGRS